MKNELLTLDWNTYRSSAGETEKYLPFLKSHSISYLIRIRDSIDKTIREYEARDDFDVWDPNRAPEQAYYSFPYEDALNKYALLCKLIAEKRMNAFFYCEWSPNRTEIHRKAEEIRAYMKKRPTVQYGEILERYGTGAERCLDYMIECRLVELRGNRKKNYWNVRDPD